jgi:hypothetical protein
MKFVSSGYCIGFAALFLSGSAENICNETSPTDRAIDGIPAYAQCSTSTAGSIYSNNGILRAAAGGYGRSMAAGISVPKSLIVIFTSVILSSLFPTALLTASAGSTAKYSMSS